MSPLDSFKAACWTALFTFVALFGTAATGWLGSDTLPDVSTVKAAALAAGGAALSGLVNWVVRFAQGRLGVGQVPVYVSAAKP